MSLAFPRLRFAKRRFYVGVLHRCPANRVRKEGSAGESSVPPSDGAHGVTRPTRELRRLIDLSWDRDRAVKRAGNFEFVPFDQQKAEADRHATFKLIIF